MIEGLSDERELIHFGGEYKAPANRHVGSYVAKGFTPDFHYVVLAKGIDQKQLSNILHSLDVVDGVAYEVDTDLVTVINNNPKSIADFVEGELASAEITEAKISQATISDKKFKKKRRK
jgi:hypothetical protein